MGFFLFLVFLFLIFFFITKYVCSKVKSSCSSSSSSSSSSSAIPQRKYDVFLSFRGEDTRDGFTGHLYKALLQKNIKTFIDNDLTRGEEISQSLLNAIEESTISVIVFSERYASSGWCLDELRKILECKHMYGQIAIPIFYHVVPSHVRKLEGTFRDSFLKIEERYKERSEKLQKWRDALKEAADLSGFDSNVIRSESELVEQIVQDILKKLKDKFPSDFNKDFVGVESCIEEIESRLSHKGMAVYTLGIWGMGGIGKTTIAGTFFNKISSQFDGSCFISNIREESQKNGGLTQLQRELFVTLLGDGNLNIGFCSFGLNFEIEMLRCKKVLIVFDDVTCFNQIEFLIGGFDRLMQGSLIIVTTRDKRVLENCGVKIIYEMEKLEDVDALKLFSWHAFKQSHPDPSCEKLSNKVMQYAQGVPLVLKVLGCFLYGRSKTEWESEIKKLESIPCSEIQKVLKVSYDGLDDREQKIFLDIACFLKGEDKDHVVRFLDACDLFGEIGISVLIERSLIIISDYKVTMHDLLQEMGREIVRQECVDYPENRSRLWNHKDVPDVLTYNLGTQAIQGICLNMYRVKEEINLSFDTFKQMPNLRFLKFVGENKFNICDLGGEGYIFRKLRYLHWDRYPLKSLPSSFRAENLVLLIFCESKIQQLWGGIQNLVNLKEINLRWSDQLMELPNLSKAQNLENLIVEGCSSLIDIHSSIRYLNKLVILNLNFCTSLTNIFGFSNLKSGPKISFCNLDQTTIEELPSSNDCLSRLYCLNLVYCRILKSLPSNLFNLKSLRILDLSNCSNLKSLPEITSCNLEYLYLNGTAIEELPSSIEFLSKLVTLDLKNCSRLNNLPNSLCKLKSLRFLYLSNCSNLKNLPEITSCNLEDGTSIDELPSLIKFLSKLSTLDLKNCSRLNSLPSSLCKLKSLQSLYLSNCSKLKSLPEIMSCNLEKLYLDGTAIEELPSSIEFLSKLLTLDLKNCSRLNSLPSSLCNLRFLRFLYLSNCSNLKSVPEITPCNLEELYLDGIAIEELPSSIEFLSKLLILDLKNCSRLNSLPSSLYKLKSLRFLYLSNCSNLNSVPEIMPCNLEELYLDGTAIEELPSSIEFLSKLLILDLKNCSRLNNLPSSLYKLKSLRFLYLSNCSNLKSLPEITCCSLEYLYLDGTAIEELPSSIEFLSKLWGLDLKNCSRLNSLPSSICKLKSLQSLRLSNCSNLKNLPEITSCNLEELYLDGTAIEVLPLSIEFLSKLLTLDLKNCSRLNSLPSSLYNLKSLQSLYLSNCSNLKSVPEITSCNLEELYLDGTAIEELPSSTEFLSKLWRLGLKNCSRLNSLSNSLCKLKSLRFLRLSNSSNLKSLPEITSCNVEYLYLDGTAIEELPSSIEFLSKLWRLDLKNCSRLNSLPSSICKLKSLQSLRLSNCSNLKNLPEITSCNLEELYLDGTAIEVLPLSIEFLSKLLTLDLKNCSRLNSLPSSLCKLKSLQDISVNDCSKLQRLPEEIGNLDSLRILEAERTGITEVPSSIKCLKNLSKLFLERLHGHEQMGFILPTSVPLDDFHSLSYLKLIDCGITELPESLFKLFSLQDLFLDKNKFERLPKSIINLSRLKRLSLNHCERLQSLPNLPSSLLRMEANQCLSLEALSGLSILSTTGPYCPIFSFRNCFELDQNELKKIVNNALQKIQPLSTGVQWKRDLFYDGLICYPGSEIPEFFKFQSMGSSLDMPPGVQFNSEPMGFVFCLIVSSGDHRGSHVMCECKVKNKWVRRLWIGRIGSVKSDHVILGYKKFSDGFELREYFYNNKAFFEFYLEDTSSGKRMESCEIVKKCGIHLNFGESMKDYSRFSVDEKEESHLDQKY